uniref:Uncharacterized protein n=1 Tax=Gopherus agassizii TaxID=38772 RepID=A0A452J2V9_9SAUR
SGRGVQGLAPSPHPGLGSMPGSLGFKPCSACHKLMPTGDPHESCLKCLGESHLADKCCICKAFKPRTKKEQDFRLRQLLMEAALTPPPSAPSTGQLAPGRSATVASPDVCSTLSFAFCHISLLPHRLGKAWESPNWNGYEQALEEEKTHFSPLE